MFIESVMKKVERIIREAAERDPANADLVHLRKQMAKSEASPIEPSCVPRHTEEIRTVLLVDEELGILSTLSNLFTTEGFSVLTANSGAAAIMSCRFHTGKIDVLVCEVEMEPVNGFEVVASVRSAHPDVAVVLISGTLLDTVQQSTDEFLLKPFPHEALLAAISRRTLSAENR